MMRILILIVLIWVLYQIIKRIVASVNTKPSQLPEETFVRCEHCGCHVLTRESHIKDDKILCNNPECQIITDEKTPHGD